MRFSLIIRALAMVRPLGLAGMLFSLLILVGYAGDCTPLFRPMRLGPATHPLSASMLALVGLGAFAWHPRHKHRLVRLTGYLVVAIAGLRLFDLLSGRSLLAALTPFGALLADQAAAGHPIAMGGNTALMCLCFGLALLAIGDNRYRWGQQLSFAGLGFPLVSVTGYAYGIERFHGQMAISTVLAALLVGFALFLSGAHRGFLRSILSPWIGGRIARIQIVLGYAIPFLIGYGLALTVVNNPLEQFGLFVVLVSAFISALVAFSAQIQEQVDRSRRVAERRLVLVATQDALTGLPNRRSLFEHGQWLIEHHCRERQAFSVLLLDIDHFKRINDTHGHPVGDAVLGQLARVARQALRRQDFMARYGGEEFVVLMPGTPLEGGRQLADKLRRHLATSIFPGGEPVTISVGCAEWVPDESLEGLLARADAALYQAKRGGRNRVVCGAPPLAADAACRSA